MKKLLILSLAVFGFWLVNSHSTLAKSSHPIADKNVQIDTHCGVNSDPIDFSRPNASLNTQGVQVAKEVGGCNSRCTPVYCQDKNGKTYLCRCDCPEKKKNSDSDTSPDSPAEVETR